MGWEKVACWSTKAAISLKRVKIEEKLLWRAYRKSQSSFEWYHPDPYGLPSPRLEVRNSNPKLQSPLSQERLKLYGQQIWPQHSQVPSEQKPMKKCWRKGSVRVSRDCPNFLSTPIISGMGKDKNFKLCTHIRNHTIDRNRSPLKISA